MDTNTIVKVEVEAKSKFGILNKLDGKWLNTKDAAVLAPFKVGNSYDVEMAASEGKDGKTYMNIVKGTETAVGEAKKPFVKRSFGGGSYQNDPKKDKRILVQGITQAVLQSPLMTFAKSGKEMELVEPLVVKLIEMVTRLAA